MRYKRADTQVCPYILEMGNRRPVFQTSSRGRPMCLPIKCQKSETGGPDQKWETGGWCSGDQSHRQTDIRLLNSRGRPMCLPTRGTEKQFFVFSKRVDTWVHPYVPEMGNRRPVFRASSRGRPVCLPVKYQISDFQVVGADLCVCPQGAQRNSFLYLLKGRTHGFAPTTNRCIKIMRIGSCVRPHAAHY